MNTITKISIVLSVIAIIAGFSAIALSVQHNIPTTPTITSTRRKVNIGINFDESTSLYNKNGVEYAFLSYEIDNFNNFTVYDVTINFNGGRQLPLNITACALKYVHYTTTYKIWSENLNINVTAYGYTLPLP